MGIKINCDMCGSEKQLYKTELEGATLNLCQKCAKFGKVLAPIRKEIDVRARKQEKDVKMPEKDISLIIAGDYAMKIKQKREKLGLKQEDFAKKINEKVSTIHHVETGKLEPSLKLARKLERFLKIKIVEEHEEVHKETKNEETKEHFTIGDFIKIKHEKS